MPVYREMIPTRPPDGGTVSAVNQSDKISSDFPGVVLELCQFCNRYGGVPFLMTADGELHCSRCFEDFTPAEFAAWLADSALVAQQDAATIGNTNGRLARSERQWQAAISAPSTPERKEKSSMKEIVKFPINTPVEVALRFEGGRHVEGRYGDQVMYSLLDNRVMYVPPYVEQRIQELAVGAGEPLLLCKKEVKDGNRKWIEWSVRRAPQQPPSSANVPVAAETAQSKAAPSHGNGNTNGKANGSANGSNGHANGSNGGPRLELVATTVTAAGISAMEIALNGATELAQRVESRAASKNYSVRFSGEDIRAIGLTIFIQAMRDGGVRWQQ
jgi:hypothetical protein